MINNFLYGGYPGPGTPEEPLDQVYFLPSQRPISELLVAIVGICVPLMLCVKPLYLIYCKKPHVHAAEFDRVEPVDEEGQLISP